MSKFNDLFTKTYTPLKEADEKTEKKRELLKAISSKLGTVDTSDFSKSEVVNYYNDLGRKMNVLYDGNPMRVPLAIIVTPVDGEIVVSFSLGDQRIPQVSDNKSGKSGSKKQVTSKSAAKYMPGNIGATLSSLKAYDSQVQSKFDPIFKVEPVRTTLENLPSVVKTMLSGLKATLQSTDKAALSLTDKLANKETEGPKPKKKSIDQKDDEYMDKKAVKKAKEEEEEEEK